MKAFTVIVLSASLVLQVAHADTIFLQGVVPDRGIVVSQGDQGATEIALQQGTELKVTVAPYSSGATSRSPQSENTNGTVWKKMTGLKTLKSSAYIRVEAP